MKHRTLSLVLLSALIGTASIAHAEGERHRGPHGEKMFEKIDTDGDGAISKAESMAFHEARFNEMDANKDGKVTKEEGKAHFEAKRAEWKAKRDAAPKQ